MSADILESVGPGGDGVLTARAQSLFQERLDANYRLTSHVFTVLMLLQWLAGILVAALWSPYAWAGRVHSVHVHVYTAVFLGGAISSLPIFLTITRPAAAITRYVVAIAQMLWSALLIHLTGGRIETHFHIFGSLAFLSFYRDWRVLIPATLVVASDHLLRGLLWPESVFGVANAEWWWFLEHSSWVVFEDVVLVLACVRGVRETRLVSMRQAEVERSLGRVSQLNAELDGRVSERTQQLSNTNRQLNASLESLSAMQTQLVDASRKAGMAEVASAVLHNVGNVLNSVNVSSGVIAELVRDTKASGLGKLSALLSQPDFASVLEGHPKGHEVPAYVARLANALREEGKTVAREVEEMQRSIDHIKVIVRMQQSNAKDTGGLLELLPMRALAEEVVKMSGVADKQNQIEVAYDFADVPTTLLDRHKICQILLNLLNNARHAIRDAQQDGGHITLRLRQEADRTLALEVEDDGCGILPEHLKKVFGHGFTTRKDGHGFGLHNSACNAAEMGGKLSCRSEGAGRGAVFRLTLPAPTPSLAALN